MIGIATCILWPSIQYLRPAEPTGNASVCFVKQHSFTDVWTATLTCALIELVLRGKSWKEHVQESKKRRDSEEITEG